MSDCLEACVVDHLLVWTARFAECGCIAIAMKDRQADYNDNFVEVCKERGLNVELVLGPVEYCPCPHGSKMLSAKTAKGQS